MKDLVLIAALAGLTGRAAAQGGAYAQCGGIGWAGATSCVNGYTCTYSNPYYSQCLPGGNGNGNGGTTTVTVTTTQYITNTVTVTDTETDTVTSTETDWVTVDGGCSSTGISSVSSTTSGTTGPTCNPSDGAPFEYFGVNESGAEFGNTVIPGELGKDYTWPSQSSIDYFLANGFNTFRIPTLMERIAPPETGLSDGGGFNETYLAGLYGLVDYIVANGGYAIVDVHNYGRYNGSIIEDVTGFGNFWQFLSQELAFSPNIIFDLMNEFHDMDQTLVWQLNQAGISAIRSNGLTNLILVEGNSYTGAWTWVEVNADTLQYLFDPINNFAFEMHQYLDSDGSGTSVVCVNNTIGVDRVTEATEWCQSGPYNCFLGEFAGGDDPICTEAISGMLCYLKENGWLGALWWGAGPWWGDYIYSIEPPSGTELSVIVPLLEEFE